VLHIMALPAPAAAMVGSQGHAAKQGSNDGTGFFEEEGSGEDVLKNKKDKKLPWLLIAGGAVAAGLLVYLLVIKKPKYTLTVSLGANCTGTPLATSTYKKGAVVNYSYAAQAGYGNLQVKLDGVLVAASGSVTMDDHHELAVSAEQLDIRGSWELTFVFLTPGYVDRNYTSEWTFSGTMTTGTFVENDHGKSYNGTYQVTNHENVWFKYSNYSDTFTGKITGKQMSGIFTGGSKYNGTWSGTKKTSAAASSAPQQAPTAPSPSMQKPKHG
jgi:hypothetical protein